MWVPGGRAKYLTARCKLCVLSSMWDAALRCIFGATSTNPSRCPWKGQACLYNSSAESILKTSNSRMAPVPNSRHRKAPLNYSFSCYLRKLGWGLLRSGWSKEVSMSFKSVGNRHLRQQPVSCPAVNAGSSGESSHWVLSCFPCQFLSPLVLLHLPEVRPLCPRLLKTCLGVLLTSCLSFPVANLSHERLSYWPSFSILKLQELHQHPLQSKAQAVS